jgi:hypothetical protein
VAIDERIRQELSRLDPGPADLDRALVGSLEAARRHLRRRRVTSSAVLLTVLVALVAGAVARLAADSDERAPVVSGLGADRWRPMAPAPLDGRSGHSLVWTGREVLVWGGNERSASFADGAAYDPKTDRWRTIAPAPVAGRAHHASVWTGRELVVWGGADHNGAGRLDGAAYDPATNRWRRIAASPLSARFRPAAVWTGSEMLVVGGSPVREHPDMAMPTVVSAPGQSRPSTPTIGGAAYDPVADRWRTIADGPIPGESAPYTPAAWTGTELYVLVGGPAVFAPTGLSSGRAPGSGLPAAAYDPARDRWRELPAVPVPVTTVPTLTWTGKALVALNPAHPGATYDPARDRWLPVPAPPRQGRFGAYTAHWTGREVVLAADLGFAYDPDTERWRTLPQLPAARDVEEMGSTWTGEVVVVWGGFRSSGGNTDTGALYRPPA